MDYGRTAGSLPEQAPRGGQGEIFAAPPEFTGVEEMPSPEAIEGAPVVPAELGRAALGGMEQGELDYNKQFDQQFQDVETLELADAEKDAGFSRQQVRQTEDQVLSTEGQKVVAQRRDRLDREAVRELNRAITKNSNNPEQQQNDFIKLRDFYLKSQFNRQIGERNG